VRQHEATVEREIIRAEALEVMRLKLDLAQRCTAVMALVAFVDRLGAVDLLDLGIPCRLRPRI
jgi:hypothetical protein